MAAASAASFQTLAAGGAGRLLSTALDLTLPTPLLKIGGVIPVLDFPIWPIALFDPSERLRIGFADGSFDASMTHVQFDARHGDADVNASFAIDSAGRIERAQLTARLPTAVATMKMEFVPARPVSLVVPRKVSERYQSGLDLVCTEITHSHLRRFDNSGVPIDSR